MPLRSAVSHRATLLIAALMLGGCSDGARSQAGGEAPVADVPPAAGASGVVLPNFVPLVEEYGDAVVYVEVMEQAPARAAGPELMPDDPMFEFFRRFGIPVPGMGGPPAPSRGAGSGFIVSADGYILTNAHVVRDADRVTVRLTDRREFQAKVVGTDARTDVAVIRIEAGEDLPVVRIGDPSQLRPGQWVLAIGSPFGLQNSVTAGIVSATSRAVGENAYVPFIQTDVAVNPGNSGGPLFNIDGAVVGINSMIFSRSGGYMGLSFAIPIDVAIDVRDQLIETGRVVRGRIGVAVQDVTAQLAASFGLDRPRGALVSAAEAGGPAEKAGLRPGDIILAVGDEPVEGAGELSAVISGTQPGRKVELTVWRDGRERRIDVGVTELQEEAARAATGSEQDAAQLGMVVRPLTAEEKAQAGTRGSLLVERVSGVAALAGVRPGDIILGVNGRPVTAVRELRDQVTKAKGSVALLVERDGAQIFIPVRVG